MTTFGMTRFKFAMRDFPIEASKQATHSKTLAWNPPMTGEQALFLLHFGVAALFVLLGIPLMLNRVAPNHWYGFRTRQTLSDPAVWYPVNEMTGWWMMATGFVTFPVTIAVYTLGVDAGLASLIDLLPIMFGTFGMFIHGLIMIRQLGQSKD